MDLEFTLTEKEFQELKDILEWALVISTNIEDRANARNLLRIFNNESMA
jgi:hypothetical protein